MTENNKRAANGLPSRVPDLSFSNEMFWFEEMVGIVDFEADYVGPCGRHVVFLHDDGTDTLKGSVKGESLFRDVRFPGIVSKKYIEWKRSKAESILVGEPCSETKKQ